MLSRLGGGAQKHNIKHENSFNLEKHTFRTHKETHTLYVLNNFCFVRTQEANYIIHRFSSLFKYLFFLQSEFTFIFKVQSANTMFSVIADSRGVTFLARVEISAARLALLL